MAEIITTPSNPRDFANGMNIPSLYPFDEWKDFDYLTNNYPAFKERIQQARNAGIPDSYTEKFLRENVEPRLNFIAKKEQVNNFLGRTPETMQRSAEYESARRFDAYKKAFPDKSDEEISNAIGISQWSGVAAHTLLQIPELYKKLTEGQKIREGLLQSAERGFSNYMTQRDIAHIGTQYLRGTISREEAYKQEEELSQKYIQAPLIETGLNKFVEGGAKVTTQGYNTAFKGALTGAAVGGIGALLGAPLGVGHAGFATGYKIGSLAMAANELFELQAGADMLEFSKMTDENGQPINENAARIASIITGGVTVATELVTLPGMIKLFPGADKLLGLNKNSVKKALTNPVVQEQLSKIAIDTAKGIGWGTVNNVVESLGHDVGIPIAQYISGQPFPEKDLGIVEHVIEATTTSLRDFSASAIPGLVLKLGTLGKNTVQYKNALREISQKTGIEEAEVERQLVEAAQLVEDISQKAQPKEQETIEATTEIPTQEITPQPEAQQPAPEITAPEKEIEAPKAEPKKPDFIFLPAQQLEELREQQPEITPEPAFTADKEAAITPEQYEQLKQDAPEFTVSVQNDTRYGADGSTISEAVRKIEQTDEAKSQFFHSPENEKRAQDVTQDFINAGETQEKAELAGKIIQAINASFLAREGVELTNITVKEAQQNQVDADFSRIQGDYDINNPQTWPDQERAQQFTELNNFDKLTEIERTTKELIETISKKKPEKAEDLSKKNKAVLKGLKEEAPERVKSSRNEILRQEIEEHKTTLSESAREVIKSLNDNPNINPDEYELNSFFPKGKIKKPDATFSFENFDGKTKVDISSDGADLKVRVKHYGTKETATFSIKNFRAANLQKVVTDLLGGHSEKQGVKISETPTGQYINNALTAFWKNNGLQLSQQKITEATEQSSVTLPETNRELMPEAARFQLAQDEANWKKSVDDVMIDDSVNTRSRKQIPVMRTPLVLTLAGAKHLPITINNGKLKLILRDHETMTQDILKDVPRAITDPIAIFKSSENASASGLVVLTEIRDANGADVIAAFHLNQKGEINKLASSYPQAKHDGSPKFQWFKEQAEQGNLLYLNNEKAKAWTEQSGVDILPFAENVKNEKDLLNLWNEHKENGYYYTTPEGEPISFTNWKFGRAFINLIKSGNFAANVHEVGHVAFNLMANLAKQGSLQMQEDFETILKHADVTREAWDADTKSAKGGAREKAHEYFSKAFEVYLSEGKAPSKGLKKVFERVRKFLLEIYSDITQQLGVEIDDDVRGVFDRLFTLPGDEDASIADIALDDMRISNQIAEYTKQQRILQEEHERHIVESMQGMQLLEEAGGDIELDEQAVRNVEDWNSNKDYYEILTEEYEAIHGNTGDIASFIKEQGGLNLASLEEYEGKEAAKDIYNKWRKLFKGGRKGGMSLDEMAHFLAEAGFNDFVVHGEAFGDKGSGSANALIEWLNNTDPDTGLYAEDAPAPPTANYKVDTNLVNALLASDGVDGTVDYLKERRRQIQNESKRAYISDETARNSEVAEIDSWLEKLDAANESDAETPAKKSKKQNASRSELKKAAATGYKMGVGEERETQRMKQEVEKSKRLQKLQELQNAHSERVRALREEYRAKGKEKLSQSEQSYHDKLQALKEQNRQEREQLRQSFREEKKSIREADRTNYKERLSQFQERMREKQAAREDKLTARHQKEIDRLNERIQNLRSFQNTASEKRNINRMIKGIARMAKSPSIAYDRLTEIQALLENYDFSKDRNELKQRDLIRNFLENEGEQYTSDMLDEAGLTQQDVEDFLNKTHVEDMTLTEIRNLHQEVSKLYEQGRREFAQWQAEKEKRRADMHKSLVGDLLARTKEQEPRVISGHEDLNKKFMFGKVGELARNYWDAVHTPGRFLEYELGENFRRIFEDGFTERRGIAHNFMHLRETNLLQGLKQLGLSLNDLFKNAITIDGENYTWEEVMSIYLGMKNDKHSKAILWGNFVNNLADRNKPYSTEQEGMNAINKILEFINQNENYKKAAELFMRDFDEHYERINRAGIENFNQGMNKEENYTPMFRLRHQSNQGLIDAETENLGTNGDKNALLRKVANNFTIPRQEINALNQQPIDLHLVSVWFDAMNMQEYNAALGGYAADVVSSLLLRGENGSVQEIIKSRLGVPDWNTLRDIFNDSVTDKASQEQNAANKIADYLVQARSIAYVPYNIPTVLAQFSSYFTAIPYTSRGHLMRSLFKAIDMGRQGRFNEFLESVYQKSPELRHTANSPVDRAISQNFSRQGSGFKNETLNSASNIMRKFIADGYKGVQALDNWTKSIVFDAVYQLELENGRTEEDAIRLANRAVRDTQPASTNRESTRMNRGRGVSKLVFTQFMNALAPLFNMAVIDVAHNLAHPSINTVKAVAWQVTAVGLSIAYAQFMKDLFSGKLPTGEELPNGETDDWPKWFGDTTVDNLINNVPVFNRLIDFVRRLQGRKSFRHDDRFTEPFEALYKAADYYSNPKYDGEYNGRAIEELVKGLSLIGVPIPFSGIRNLLRMLGFWRRDEQ